VFRRRQMTERAAGDLEAGGKIVAPQGPHPVGQSPGLGFARQASECFR
jgi:hypothetical protein